MTPSPRAWDLIPKTLAQCHSLRCLHTQTLLELGASPDYKDSYGLTPLYHTAIVGGDPGCCELLLHEHATLCCPDENGWHEIHQVRGPRATIWGDRGSPGGKKDLPGMGAAHPNSGPWGPSMDLFQGSLGTAPSVLGPPQPLPFRETPVPGS